MDSCPDPTNISQWIHASKLLNCPHDPSTPEDNLERVYHCMPSSFLNETVEFCGRNVPIDEGNHTHTHTHNHTHPPTHTHTLSLTVKLFNPDIRGTYMYTVYCTHNSNNFLVCVRYFCLRKTYYNIFNNTRQ